MTLSPEAPLGDALGRIVGPRWVRSRPAELATYRADGLPTHESTPRLVVLPADRDQVIAVVRLLHLLGVPFVARGAGTGLSGGALADGDAVLITLTRMCRILEVQASDRRAVVQPGVVNARLSEAGLPHGLQYVPVPPGPSPPQPPGRGSEPISLVPRRQIPVRCDEAPASWLGGLPMMPDDMEWPRGINPEKPDEGERPLHFVAQIACADLPPELWGGLGPRQGWLLFFLNSNASTLDDGKLHQVIHTRTLGAERHPPDALWAVPARVLTGRQLSNEL